MYQNHCTNKTLHTSHVYQPFNCQNLMKKTTKCRFLCLMCYFQGILFQVWFARMNLEIQILHSFRQFQKNPSENYLKPLKIKTKIKQHNLTSYMFDSSTLFKEKGGTNSWLMVPHKQTGVC